jgi:hypothetical protein
MEIDRNMYFVIIGLSEIKCRLFLIMAEVCFYQTMLAHSFEWIQIRHVERYLFICLDWMYDSRRLATLIGLEILA